MTHNTTMISGKDNMYRYLFLFSFIFFSNNTLAADNLFSGQFGHKFTETGNEPVWGITLNNNGFELVYLSDKEKAQLHLLSQQEHKQFWEKMWWPIISNQQAQCIGDNIRVFCYVPAESRQKNNWLKNYISDYFYYDSFIGVTEIYRISE